MNVRILAPSLFLVLLPALTYAQTWTSPDGFLSITPPDPARFQAIPKPPPPFLALWVSKDESEKYGVMKTEIPENSKLIQSSAEEGLAEELGGRATRLPTKTLSRHEVWNMTAKGPTAEITQAMVRHDGALYKLMAATVAGNPDTVDINKFINSLSILQPGPPPQREPVQNLGGGNNLHNISKMVGGVGGLLALGLLVNHLTRGKRIRKGKNAEIG